MPTLLPEQAKAMNAKRTRKGPRNPRSIFILAQQRLLTHIDNPKTTAANLAKCVLALDKAEERIRILSNKPLPGQLRPDLQQVKQSKRKGPSLLPLPEVPSATTNEGVVGNTGVGG